MKRAAMVLAVLLVAVSSWAATLRCGIDNGRLWATGRTKMETVILYEHRCGAGHESWLTAAQMNSRTSRARAGEVVYGD